jgi:N-acetylglucosamine-6-sulfatase
MFRALSALLALCVCALAALAADVSGPVPADAVEVKPNIVLIMTDDQTYESLRYMAQVRRLARAGTTFTNYHANFALCCPSRVTTITGQYAHNHGVWTNEDGYPALAPRAHNTLPVWLQRAGYHTMFVGRYINRYRYSRYGVPPGWDVWRSKTSSGGDDGRFNDIDLVHEDGTTHHHAGYATDTFGRLAVERVASSPPGQPFFLWLALNAPHAGGPADPDDHLRKLVPSTSPKREYRGDFEGVKAPTAGTRSFNERNVSDKPRHIRRMPRMTPRIRAAVNEAYSQQLEGLQSVDEWVGRLRRTLASQGQLDNTLLMFTTDNGYYFGEHRIRAGKQAPYPAASRLPLVVSGPGFAAGVKDGKPRSNVDLAPTIVAAAGAEPGRSMDGRPLTRDVPHQRPILMEGRIPGRSASVRYDIRQFTAIRTRTWFFARYRYVGGGRDSELYHLRRDPRMLNSLPGMPDRRARLRARMKSMAGYRV